MLLFYHHYVSCLIKRLAIRCFAPARVFKPALTPKLTFINVLIRQLIKTNLKQAQDQRPVYPRAIHPKFKVVELQLLL